VAGEARLVQRLVAGFAVPEVGEPQPSVAAYFFESLTMNWTFSAKGVHGGLEGHDLLPLVGCGAVATPGACPVGPHSGPPIGFGCQTMRSVA